MHEQRHRYLFSSWNTIYRALLGMFGTGRYILGAEVTGSETAGESVTVSLAGGSRAEADLLVCADGVTSPARTRLLPEATPCYAGYVAWHGTLPERAAPPAVRKMFGDAITYQVLEHSHVLIYPIPGLDGSLAEGDRLINVVWYVNVGAGEELDALMTGRDGIRRAGTCPPRWPPGNSGSSALAGNCSPGPARSATAPSSPARSAPETGG